MLYQSMSLDHRMTFLSRHTKVALVAIGAFAITIPAESAASVVHQGACRPESGQATWLPGDPPAGSDAVLCASHDDGARGAVAVVAVDPTSSIADRLCSIEDWPAQFWIVDDVEPDPVNSSLQSRTARVGLRTARGRGAVDVQVTCNAARPRVEVYAPRSDLLATLDWGLIQRADGPTVEGRLVFHHPLPLPHGVELRAIQRILVGSTRALAGSPETSSSWLKTVANGPHGPHGPAYPTTLTPETPPCASEFLPCPR